MNSNTNLERLQPDMGRPLPVFLIAAISMIPLLVVVLFLRSNWAEMNTLLQNGSLSVLEISGRFFRPLLLVFAGVLLLFMRKEAILAFITYAALGVIQIVYTGPQVLFLVDLMVLVPIIWYCYHLDKQGRLALNSTAWPLLRKLLPVGDGFKLTLPLLCWFIALHLFYTFKYFPLYFELVRSGAVMPLSFIVAALGTFLLFAAGVFAWAKPGRGKILFLISALGLALAGVLWRSMGGMGYLLMLGAVLAAIGWQLSRKESSTLKSITDIS